MRGRYHDTLRGLRLVSFALVLSAVASTGYALAVTIASRPDFEVPSGNLVLDFISFGSIATGGVHLVLLLLGYFFLTEGSSEVGEEHHRRMEWARRTLRLTTLHPPVLLFLALSLLTLVLVSRWVADPAGGPLSTAQRLIVVIIALGIGGVLSGLTLVLPLRGLLFASEARLASALVTLRIVGNLLPYLAPLGAIALYPWAPGSPAAMVMSALAQGYVGGEGLVVCSAILSAALCLRGRSHLLTPIPL